MSIKHIVTKNIGNLRGFSTDNIFVRPPNVADKAINLQRAPDTSLQIRRGYQCEIAEIGGMGIGTFDDPNTNEIHTVTLSTNGQVYNKLTKQIFFYYDGQIDGTITNITQANPALVTAPLHGLISGTIILIQNVTGMTQVNNLEFTINVTGPNNFELVGIDSTAYTPYVSGGTWLIAFTQYRNLLFTIFTDPRFLTTNPGWSIAPWSLSPWGAPSGESITCNITVNRAAVIFGNQTLVNTMTVQFGHELNTGDVIQFYDSSGVAQQRIVLGVTATTITFDGYPVSLLNGAFVNQFFDIPFRKGFDVASPYLISTFISAITDPINGVIGLKIAINGDSNYPAAFLQIIEPVIIDSNRKFVIDYWYWQIINHTVTVPFPGTANPTFQNSPDFEVASMACYDDVLYIANGWDYPQKYDGQTVYRVGMPQGDRPFASDDVAAPILPFVTGDKYIYAITYEQVDNRGHVVEGVISENWAITVVAANAAIDVVVRNIMPNTGWNTDGAIAGAAATTVYGPDSNGFYYDAVTVTAGYTLRIGDNAFYIDTAIATVNGAQVSVNTIVVNAGHGVVPGDTVTFVDTVPAVRNRIVDRVTATSITIEGAPVSVGAGIPISTPITSPVFGDIAIVNGPQNNVTTINVVVGHSIQINDVVSFVDTAGDTQRRTVTGTAAGTITISGISVSVGDRILITAEQMAATIINLQRLNSSAAVLTSGAPISNNLRILIYRTDQGGDELKFLAEIPNNSNGTSTQTFVDEVTDAELGFRFPDPIVLPNPPPISKYLKVFGNQLLYGGGERNNSENDDKVFFSDGGNPEYVSTAQNFFQCPTDDDEITGLGVSGSTLIVTKFKSVWALAGELLTSQYEISQLSPGSNIGCVAHASIVSIGSLLYLLDTTGVYSITESQFFPVDSSGCPIPVSLDIDVIFRETNYLPQTRYVFKRAIAFNYTKDKQYLLFLPCEDIQSSIRTANQNSAILSYDYQGKNWFYWDNMNAAGGMFDIDNDLYFQERRFSGVDGNTANLYKQHRFYRLVDHADHTSSQRCEWRSSWEDLGQPEVRKKFCRCVLLMDRLSNLYQLNAPKMFFSSYLDRIPNLQSTMSQVTPVDNIRNSSWSYTPWGYGFWAGYLDSFVLINLRQGTVAKSMQVGFTITGINMDIRFSGYQLEVIPENRRTIVR